MTDWEVISKLYPVYGEAEFDFAANSTIGCGGKARGVLYPANVSETEKIFRFFRSEKIPFLPLGNGSNILASDRGMDGFVLRLERMKHIAYLGNGVLYADAGVSVRDLSAFCLENNLTGCEFLCGIPATLGGLLYMNAGVTGFHIGDIADSVVALGDGGIRIVPNEECAFGNKTSVFMQTKEIILGAKLKLAPAEKYIILQKKNYFLSRRKDLPYGKSMGCVFVNPQGISAGALIQMAGMKGKRIGGAVVSEKHANFILNTGGATSADIQRLIAEIRSAVYRLSGVNLKEEIQYIGAFT